MRTWIFLILLFTIKGAFCQENLISNGDFEDHYAIPVGFLKSTDQIENYIPHWKSPTNGSPDYFHRTSPDNFNNIPVQNFGNQFFIKEKCINYLNDTFGNAFVGMGIALVNSKGEITYYGNEYIQTKLNLNKK